MRRALETVRKLLPVAALCATGLAIAVHFVLPAFEDAAGDFAFALIFCAAVFSIPAFGTDGK